ncbi:hypothetical protein [Xanthomonas fragariae]|uniref:hypothetical protein n=1 Tax=Xanthomonas fragariae TaxID=48664 RepID=UPI0022AAE000|nr:hypothetical protein [Xanthomonas fragariae]WAT15273.1 hypothetical protein OZ429_01735 [Xanthomonas fragariae]
MKEFGQSAVGTTAIRSLDGKHSATQGECINLSAVYLRCPIIWKAQRLISIDQLSASTHCRNVETLRRSELVKRLPIDVVGRMQRG